MISFMLLNIYFIILDKISFKLVSRYNRCANRLLLNCPLSFLRFENFQSLFIKVFLFLSFRVNVCKYAGCGPLPRFPTIVIEIENFVTCNSYYLI
jgi:hypothetical protein